MPSDRPDDGDSVESVQRIEPARVENPPEPVAELIADLSENRTYARRSLNREPQLSEEFNERVEPSIFRGWFVLTKMSRNREREVGRNHMHPVSHVGRSLPDSFSSLLVRHGSDSGISALTRTSAANL